MASLSDELIAIETNKGTLVRLSDQLIDKLLENADAFVQRPNDFDFEYRNSLAGQITAFELAIQRLDRKASELRRLIDSLDL